MASGPDIPEPDIVNSRNGVLQVTLTQAPALVTVAGQSFRSNVFNGQYIPPVLKMQRGDRLELSWSTTSARPTSRSTPRSPPTCTTTAWS
jgi:hypothetical protein